MTAIHQIVPTLSERDAIGNHALKLQQILRSEGIASEIFTEYTPAPPLRNRVRHYKTFGDASHDAGATLLYQGSTGSKVFEWLLGARERMVMNYHNVTPPEFFQPWDPNVALELRVGRRQIEELASVMEFAIAVSDYNASELGAFGYRKTTVVPILLDVAAFDHEPDPELFARLEARKAAGSVEWLFVGRIAPNKAQQDIIKSLAYARTVLGQDAHLTLVGSCSSPTYLNALRAFVNDLGLTDAVTFADSVSSGILSAYYQSADAFVCLSEHEGFCVPLLEAMHHRLPVVAFGATAVGATVGDGGLVTYNKQPAVIAEAVARVVSDPALRDQLAAAGAKRVAAFSYESTRVQMLNALAPYLA